MSEYARETFIGSKARCARVGDGSPCEEVGSRLLSIKPQPVEDDFDSKEGSFGPALSFSVVRDLGRGGEGRVLAVEYSGGQLYALKIFNNAESARNEWTVLNAQKNSRVVPYPYVIGTIRDTEGLLACGQWCIVMEMIEGVSLQSLIREKIEREEVFSMEECASVLEPIIRFAANSCTSRRPDVHRDIKPNNIIVEKDGRTRLVDFGFSARVGSDSAGGSGSYGYSAPELQDFSPCGDSDCRNDSRVDTYSIASVMLVMLSGKEPAWENAYDDTLARVNTLEILHDSDMVRDLVEALRNDVRSNFAMTPSETVLDNSIQVALAGIDADVKDALFRALAIDQSERLTPFEFENRLAHVINKGIFEKQVIVESRARCYAYERGVPTAFDTDAANRRLASEGTFVEGLNAFNRGEYVTALPILRRQSRLGNVSASYYLAVCLRDGLGVVNENRDEIVSLLTEASNQGNILAMNALGRLLLEKEGLTEFEKSKAIEWIRLAAAENDDQGNPGFKPARDWLLSQGIW